MLSTGGHQYTVESFASGNHDSERHLEVVPDDPEESLRSISQRVQTPSQNRRCAILNQSRSERSELNGRNNKESSTKMNSIVNHIKGLRMNSNGSGPAESGQMINFVIKVKQLIGLRPKEEVANEN